MPRPGNIKRDLEILAKLTALKMGVLQRPDSRPARCGLNSAAAIPNSARYKDRDRKWIAVPRAD